MDPVLWPDVANQVAFEAFGKEAVSTIAKQFAVPLQTAKFDAERVHAEWLDLKVFVKRNPISETIGVVSEYLVSELNLVIHQYDEYISKRFLRKPNVAEASGQYNALGKQLRNQEIPHYAGFCCLAVARCEHTLGNPNAEAQALVYGARLFLDAEKQNHDLKCPSFNEHLNAATSCYSHAIKVYMEQNQMALAASLCLELGNSLRSLDQPAEAIPHFQKAAELQSQCTLDYLNALDLVGSCKIQTDDYDGALTTYTEMSVIADKRSGGSNNGCRMVGVFSDILARCEVTRVLLLLLLQPTHQRLQTEHVQTLEKYAWESSDLSSTATSTEDCFLLLQSVVMACQSHDVNALKVLQKDLWYCIFPIYNFIIYNFIYNLPNIFIYFLFILYFHNLSHNLIMVYMRKFFLFFFIK
ncbi:Factor VIII intron 22 protein [Nymphon striatum]|nr:Factor VIII intron 22 protein [Nymphon striatum]